MPEHDDDPVGSYAFARLGAGTYKVTPSKAGCTFTPASANVNVTALPRAKLHHDLPAVNRPGSSLTLRSSAQRANFPSSPKKTRS